MILFCEECGTRHDIDENLFSDNRCQFTCHVCSEKLVVSLVDKAQGKTIEAAMQQDMDSAREISGKPLNVLVVDDSRMIRRVLSDIIESRGDKKVVGEAENGKEALSLLKTTEPDVITLDINMPVMDGLTTLKHIMINNPTPTIMISALTQEGAAETFDSLKYGAVDFLAKPKSVKGGDLASQQEEILRKIELVAAVQIESIRYLRRPIREKSKTLTDPSASSNVLTIGVSEGGYGALLNVIPRIKADAAAAYVAVMRQSPEHIDAFARYLDNCSELSVERAVEGTILANGTCYLAAAKEHVSIGFSGNRPCITRHPNNRNGGGEAIDQLMISAAEHLKDKASGIILTGTGSDGIKGLGEIIKTGGAAFVQDPRSCLFKETPTLATELYTVDNTVSDKQMAGAINAFIESITR